MRVLLVVLLKAILFVESLAKNADTTEITCSDLKNVAVVGSFFISISSKERNNVHVNFFLSTNKEREPVEISAGDWSGLRDSAFDPSKITYIIVHGYMSGGRKPWVLELKERLLDMRNANIILVDWSHGSNRKNYVNAARNTQHATDQVFNFLQRMRNQVHNLNNEPSNEMKWNHLYFIGHSLGAQVSGQVAHLLKQDDFWKVKRITGLDPAKPCFTQVDSPLRLDKGDAYFVDVIHTQVGNGGSADALGMGESVGHMDFYVNGGVAQPGCVGSMFTPKWDTMICSHKLSYKYFTESLINPMIGKCSFASFPWDGSYQDAQQILHLTLQGSFCSNCPEMGINAPKSKTSGKFLVITSTEEPYCQLKDKDLKNVIKVIRRLKGSSIFETAKPSANPVLPVNIILDPRFDGRNKVDNPKHDLQRLEEKIPDDKIEAPIKYYGFRWVMRLFFQILYTVCTVIAGLCTLVRYFNT